MSQICPSYLTLIRSTDLLLKTLETKMKMMMMRIKVTVVAAIIVTLIVKTVAMKTIQINASSQNLKQN